MSIKGLSLKSAWSCDASSEGKAAASAVVCSGVAAASSTSSAPANGHGQDDSGLPLLPWMRPKSAFEPEAATPPAAEPPAQPAVQPASCPQDPLNLGQNPSESEEEHPCARFDPNAREPEGPPESNQEQEHQTPNSTQDLTALGWDGNRFDTDPSNDHGDLGSKLARADFTSYRHRVGVVVFGAGGV